MTAQERQQCTPASNPCPFICSDLLLSKVLPLMITTMKTSFPSSPLTHRTQRWKYNTSGPHLEFSLLTNVANLNLISKCKFYQRAAVNFFFIIYEQQYLCWMHQLWLWDLLRNNWSLLPWKQRFFIPNISWATVESYICVTLSLLYLLVQDDFCHSPASNPGGLRSLGTHTCEECDKTFSSPGKLRY